MLFNNNVEILIIVGMHFILEATPSWSIPNNSIQHYFKNFSEPYLLHLSVIDVVAQCLPLLSCFMHNVQGSIICQKFHTCLLLIKFNMIESKTTLIFLATPEWYNFVHFSLPSWIRPLPRRSNPNLNQETYLQPKKWSWGPTQS